MNGQGTGLLEGLRDIHAAAAPGWWPPAPGWWLAAALVLALAFFAVRWLLRSWSARRRRLRYLAALQRIENRVDPERQPAEFVAQLNRLFRAVALRAFARADVARLQGDAWVRFVAARLPEHADALRVLAAGPWQPQPAFDASALRAAARTWVKRHG